MVSLTIAVFENSYYLSVVQEYSRILWEIIKLNLAVDVKVKKMESQKHFESSWMIYGIVFY